MPSSKGSFQHRDQTHVSCSSCIAGRFFTAEPPWNPPLYFVVVQSLSCVRLFSFSISPSNEYSGLISFRIDWFDLLAVQGTLKSLLQHHSSKASILWCSSFFMVQLSHPYMTTRKTIALTIRTSVGKVTFLVFICCLDLS